MKTNEKALKRTELSNHRLQNIQIRLDGGQKKPATQNPSGEKMHRKSG